MICPNCLIQMYQKDKLGGGKSTEKVYETWEIKACPLCKREVKEFYSAKVLKGGEK